MGLPKGVVDILPLTPAQQGMLFHSVGDTRQLGQYVAVISCSLNGPLEPERLKRALNAVLVERDAFRAGFVWKGVKQPVQVIREQVSLPWIELDWTTAKDVEQKWSDLLRLEQIRQFDLTKPPLMTATLIKISTNAWRLVWTVHHLISDGWSTGVALQDLCKHYQGLKADQPKAPPFRTYLAWLRNQHNLTDTDFWKTQFHGLEDSSVFPRPDAHSGGSVQVWRSETLGSDVMSSIESLAGQLRVTSNSILSAAWALELRRLLQQDDVVYGTTTAGRPAEIAGITRAVGAFVNTLPVRCKINPSDSVRDFLRNHAQAELNRRKHEFASLSEVQACAPIASGSPLFDTMFVNEGLGAQSVDLGEVEVCDLKTSQFSNYPLTVLVTPQKKLTVEIYHDPEIIQAKTVDAIFSGYKNILSAIIKNPEVAIKNLLQRSQNAMELRPEPRHFDVVQQFLSHAQQTPDAPAISDGQGTTTYAALSLRARQIALALKEAGVEKSDIVPVALPRGTEAISAFLGVMMSGAAYVPLDMDYPPHRITQMLDTIQPRYIVTDASMDGLLPDTDAKIVTLGSLGDAMDVTEVEFGERAYVMFTSGSQNQPKGVEISRQGLAISTAARDNIYGTPPKVYLLLSSLAFDSSVAGIYWTLGAGGHLVVADNRSEQEPYKLGKLISQHRVTHTLCLPGLAQVLLTAVPGGDLGSLETLITAGEPLYPSLVRQCRTILPDCRLVNEYGPTEATVWCTSYDATNHTGEGDIPIGSGIPGTWVGIVHKDDCPAETGQVGEIVVAGQTVALGYLNDPDQTQESFFNIGPESIRAYRTGDLGVEDASGRILFLGRKDSQVKIRGHRIELTEIEAAASFVAGDLRVAAVVLERSDSKSIGVAVESPPDAKLCDTVRRHLEATLPTPFHPNAVVCIETFPNLPNGKTDQTSLASIVARSVGNQPGAAPKDALETLVAEVFSDVLRIPCPSRDANFFDLGGDSLATIAAFSKGQDAGLLFEPTDLFSCPTVAELAKRIRDREVDQSFSEDDSTFQISNPGDGKTTVVIAHCSVQFCRYMARSLGPDCSVVLVRSHRTQGMAVPYGKSFSDLASDTISHLAQSSNTGPVVLCGYSAGCPMVMEMAKKLGPETVKGMVLLDPPFKMVGAEPALQPLYFRTYKRWRYLFKGFKRKVKARRILPRIKTSLAQEPESEKFRIQAVEIVHALAISDFRVPQFDRPAHVFLTRGNPSLRSGDVLDTHLRQKTCHPLDMKHVELMRRPDAFVTVAAALRDLIDQPVQSDKSA